MPAERLGFRRPVGAAGARDVVLVLPSVVCATLVAEQLAGDHAVAVTHQHGCLQVGDDLALSADVLAGLGTNPNVAATLVVSLGCETLQGRRLAEAIAAQGRPAELVGIQSAGGTAAARAEGSALVDRLYEQHGGREREPVPAGDIVVGLDAGDEPLAAAIEDEAARQGISVVRAPSSRGAEIHPELAAAGAQVIVSLVPDEHAAVGFALCPVVAVASDCELHAALADDFDVLPDGRDDADIAREVLERVGRTFDGEQTRAELRGAHEFVLRRVAMTM